MQPETNEANGHTNGVNGHTNGMNGYTNGTNGHADTTMDGDALIHDAERLFGVADEFFALSVEEKKNYDFKDRNSYHGYKGYGDGVMDKTGATDRNEFYNVRCVPWILNFPQN